MPTNYRAFNEQLFKFAQREVPEQFGKFMRTVALAVLRGVVLKTPVDTGRARGNWQILVGRTNETEVSGTTTSTTLKSGDVKTTFKPQKTPLQNASEELRTPIRFLGEVIYVFNNVPYINRLENGHSKKQAPRGMVKLTLNEIAASLGTEG